MAFLTRLLGEADARDALKYLGAAVRHRIDADSARQDARASAGGDDRGDRRDRPRVRRQVTAGRPVRGPALGRRHDRAGRAGDRGDRDHDPGNADRHALAEAGDRDRSGQHHRRLHDRAGRPVTDAECRRSRPHRRRLRLVARAGGRHRQPLRRRAAAARGGHTQHRGTGRRDHRRPRGPAAGQRGATGTAARRRVASRAVAGPPTHRRGSVGARTRVPGAAARGDGSRRRQ